METMRPKRVLGDFGIHQTLDLRGCDRDRLSDLNVIFALLDTLPDLLEMTKITAPYVFKYSGEVPADKGITGVVIIAESHISIHTFQEKNYAFADIFSCKPFDSEKAQSRIVDALGAKDVTQNLVTRGIGFPWEIRENSR